MWELNEAQTRYIGGGDGWEFLDYTLKELYLEYRTNPANPMSIPAASLNTVRSAYLPLAAAGAGGWLIGSFIYNHIPRDWQDAIGGSIESVFIWFDDIPGARFLACDR